MNGSEAFDVQRPTASRAVGLADKYLKGFRSDISPIG